MTKPNLFLLLLLGWRSTLIAGATLVSTMKVLKAAGVLLGTIWFENPQAVPSRVLNDCMDTREGLMGQCPDPSRSVRSAKAVLRSNQFLFDYVCRLIATSHYDHSSVGKADNKEWSEFVNGHEDRVFRSTRQTEQVIAQLLSGLHDKYSYYQPSHSTPFIADIQQVIIQRDSVVLPGMGLELQPQLYGIQMKPKLASDGMEYTEVIATFRPIVTAIFADSPAERYGLQIGDILAKANGISLAFTRTFSLPPFKTESSFVQELNNQLKSYSIQPFPPFITSIFQKLLKADTNSVLLSIYPRSSSERESFPLFSNWDSKWTAAKSMSEELHSDYFAENEQLVQLLSDVSYLRKDSIYYKSVRFSSPDHYATGQIEYVRFTTFNQRVSETFTQILLNIAQQYSLKEDNDGDRPAGIVVDLRNNYGGVVQDALEMASIVLLAESSFLSTAHLSTVLKPYRDIGGDFGSTVFGLYLEEMPGGLPHKPLPLCFVVSKRNIGGQIISLEDFLDDSSSLLEQGFIKPLLSGSKGKVLVYASNPLATSAIRYRKAILPPIVLLVNGGSASSAEIFASALQQRESDGSILVMGTRTFGKGLIQRVYKLPNEGQLRLTIAEFQTPRHKRLSHPGYSFVERRGDQLVVRDASKGQGLIPDQNCDASPRPFDLPNDICFQKAVSSILQWGE